MPTTRYSGCIASADYLGTGTLPFAPACMEADWYIGCATLEMCLGPEGSVSAEAAITMSGLAVISEIPVIIRTAGATFEQ